MSSETEIVRAAIFPAIGVARVGNSREADGFFLGPEVPFEPSLPHGRYKDLSGALKRQVARFRVYGYNAADEVVAELTSNNAVIAWTVHLANTKAAWYQFHLALDIAEASDPMTPLSARRNASVTGSDRQQLVIDSGPRTISGNDISGPQFHFAGGKFFHIDVPLGELRTDPQGRLLVFGGHGTSGSRTGTLPNTFANNEDWYDDTSDGPVDATVEIDGRSIPVEGAWVIAAPPNYAPTIQTVRTMYDLLYDRFIAWGQITPPDNVSFQQHIRPIFERLSGLQWVNLGFASWFGIGAPFDVSSILPRLADASPGNAEFRQRIAQQFRNPKPGQLRLGMLLWPQFYGDALDSLATPSPGNDPSLTVPQGLASLTSLQLDWLDQWARGAFVSDAPVNPPTKLADVELSRQPETLTEAALTYCLADAFHPGCELTWPMRHPQLYSKAFRIKRRTTPAPDFGSVLTPNVAIDPAGPLDGAAAGDLTRWMAVPWQTDTASCLSGYSFFRSSASLPTFWPARVPNDVLRDVDYQILMDRSQSEAVRRAAFGRRVDWFRVFQGGFLSDINQMIQEFHKLGLIEERNGPADLTGVSGTIWVETKPELPEPIATLGTGVTESTAAARPTHEFAKLRELGNYGKRPDK